MSSLRSWLFVPGNRQRLIEKALLADADAIVLDLEDACPKAEKLPARSGVAAALALPRKSVAYVRVNALSTELCYGDLLATARQGLDGIMLPKAESADQLRTADWFLTQLERERGLPLGRLDLVPLVETANGVSALGEICRSSPRVRRVAFGAADLTGDLGITWTPGELELLRYRSDFVLASRTAGIEPPIDLAWLSLKDTEGLKSSIEWGRALGFQGKLCIHPDQISRINAAFSPTESQVEGARRVVAAFRDAERRGLAAIQVDGSLVDYPIFRRSERLLELADRIAAKLSVVQPPAGAAGP